MTDPVAALSPRPVSPLPAGRLCQGSGRRERVPRTGELRLGASAPPQCSPPARSSGLLGAAVPARSRAALHLAGVPLIFLLFLVL